MPFTKQKTGRKKNSLAPITKSLNKLSKDELFNYIINIPSDNNDQLKSIHNYRSFLYKQKIKFSDILLTITNALKKRKSIIKEKTNIIPTITHTFKNHHLYPNHLLWLQDSNNNTPLYKMPFAKEVIQELHHDLLKYQNYYCSHCCEYFPVLTKTKLNNERQLDCINKCKTKLRHMKTTNIYTKKN